MRINKKLVVAVLLMLAVNCVAFDHPRVAAQTLSDNSAADTSSPRATLRSFIDACNLIDEHIKEREYIDRYGTRFQPISSRVIDCLDTSQLPAFAADLRATEVAVCIKEILDRNEIPPWEEIPDLAAIEAAGGFEALSRWRVPGTRLTIARMEEGPQKHEYLFSAGTVDRAVSYYRSVEASPYRIGGPKTSPGLHKWYMSAPGHPAMVRFVNRLPDRLRFGRSMGLANWKWPGLIVSLLIAVAFLVLCYRLYLSLADRARFKGMFAYWATLLFPLVAVALPILFERFTERFLTVRGLPLYIIDFISTGTAVLAAIFLVFAVGNRVAETVIASPRVNPRGLNAQLIRIASKLISLLAAAAVFLLGGQYLGIPVATLLASAGIGGIALALGAQDTLKTLFGTIMLMADTPFRVGERIMFKGYDGVVEDIGLRSTRIRLLTSHQVTVPNDQLAGCDIENIGRRECIRRVMDIHIPNDTACEKMETAVSILREQLDHHEGMNADQPARVFFVDFLPTAFTIRVMYWYYPAEHWDYMAFSEKFNFSIFRAFEENGIQFSLPQRVTHTSLESKHAPIDVRMVDPQTP